jgi:MFS family permease
MDTDNTGIMQINENGKETIWTRAFINIFLLNISVNMAQFMLNALIPKYADKLGAGATVVGMVASMFAVTALCMRPIAGPAIGYFRKNRLLALAVGFITAAFILYGFARSVPMIIAGRLLHGLGMGITGPLSLALASDTLPEKKMASGIGVFSLAQAVSTAIGPSIGLKLTDALGYNITFFIGAAVMGCSLILVSRLKTKEPARDKPFRISLDNIIAREIVTPAVIMFFLSGAYACLNSFIVIYGGLCNVGDIGLFFTAYAVCLLFTRPLSGKIADRYGLDKTMIPAIAMFALAFLCISFSHTLPMFLLSGVISSFGYGVCQPSVQTLCMRLVPSERRGVAGNTTYLGVDMGFLIMPTLAGAFISLVQNGTGSKLYGYETMFRLMILPVVIALVIFVWKRKTLLRQVEAVSAKAGQEARDAQ